MEQQEKPSNEEEKQNQEEEEFDEEDEEEKEGDKKRQEKEENKIITQNENKEQDNTSVNTDKDQISEKKEEQNEVPQPKLEENTPQEKTESNDKIQNNEKNNEKNSDEQINNEENEVEQEESSSSYILKYVRKNNEPRESTYDKELIKSKKCLYMIEFKILKGKTEKYLLVYCHEIAAIYFDEIYEKKYSIKDLYKENRHFRIFDEVEEAKDIIDEILNGNATNIKKIFIDCQDNEFKLHLNISFFDKDNEVILNIPKKNITDKERIKLLPEFLKEIQIKMNHLEEDNKKLKNEYKNMGVGENSLNGVGGADDEFFGEKERKNKSKKKKKKKIIKK